MTRSEPPAAVTELLPCPFCGDAEAPRIFSNGIGDLYVRCEKDEERGCGASTSDQRCETEGHAVERWNRRTQRSEPPADVIENVLRMLRESARWHDEENRPYSAGVERDAIALIESLRTSSSLGGIEGGVARPMTACAPQVLDIVRRPPAIIDDREARQKSVHEWCSAAFGADAASSVAQRGVRLLEEAVELYQAAGCERTMGHLLIDFVFDRPKGKLAKEIGQVGLVLLSMAEAAGVSADEEEVKEVFRVREKPLSHYAARNQAKNAAGFNTAGAELAGAEQVRGVSAEPQPPIASPAGALTAEKAVVQDLIDEGSASIWRVANFAIDAIKKLKADKDAAYLERNQVVAALASLFPSGIARTDIPGWLPEWHGCVYIDLPTGQASWHYHDSHALLFAHLPPYAGKWDGHTTEEKYLRLAALPLEAQSFASRGEATASPSSARERRKIIEECAQEADIVLKSNFMTRGAQLVDIVVPRIRALAALSSDGRGREEK